MKIEFCELISNGYTLRGLFSKPESEFTDLVVMLHGFTGHKNENGYLFKQLTQTLTDNKIATLRYDFMGSGESDGNFEDFTFFTELEDARNIIKEAFILNNNRKIILLGFSMGGAVASRISLEMKDYITKLILLSPAGNIAKLIHSRFENHLIDENGNIDMGGYYMNIKMDKTLEGYDMYKDIETFELPVLIIQGKADQSVPPMYSKKYDELYPNSEYVLINGSEHCYTKVMYRKILNEKVMEFINKK
ncbi:MAG: alpha/beta hydrolase [Bacilli bacterium]|jgi:alpha/beta fold family hydrolase-like protein|nr:alpha/beta fold hydrolase [Staphylococcus sp.]